MVAWLAPHPSIVHAVYGCPPMQHCWHLAKLFSPFVVNVVYERPLDLNVKHADFRGMNFEGHNDDEVSFIHNNKNNIRLIQFECI